MATKAITGTPSPNINYQRVSWLAMLNGDVGATWGGNDFQDRSVQVTGTFSTGGSVTIKGSNDGGVTWSSLTDPLGNVLTFTAAGMKQITEVPELIRPEVTAGDGSTSLNVYLFARGDFR